MCPILPPELESRILSSLKNPELLKFRLVCKSWDAECRRLLNSRKLCLRLSDKNLAEFLAFVSTRCCTSAWLPIFLNIDIKPPLDIIYNQSSEETESQLNKIVEDISKDAASLLQLLGSESIVSLCFRSIVYGATGFLRLLTFLQLLSPGLVVLNLERYEARLDSSTTDEIRADILRGLDELPVPLHFSKLRTLILRRATFGTELEKFYLPFYKRLTDAGPLIEEWVREFSFDSSFGSLPLERLKVLKLGPIVDPSEFLHMIERERNAGSFRPVLEHLVLHIERGPGVHREILKAFSPTLKFLKVAFRRAHYEAVDLNQYLHLPEMPALTSLRIRGNDRFFPLPNIVDPLGNINLRPEMLPNLNSVDLPFGLFIREQTTTSGSSVVFPKVNGMIVRFYGLPSPSDSDEDEDAARFKEMKNCWENLQGTFPSVSVLVVKRQTSDTRTVGTDIQCDQVIRSLLHSSGAHTITDLEIRNFGENYLGRYLHHMKYPPRIIVENFEEMNPRFLRYLQVGFQQFGGGWENVNFIKTTSSPEEVEDGVAVPGAVTTNRTLVQCAVSPVNNLSGLRKIRFTYMRKSGLKHLQMPHYFETIPSAFPNLCLLEVSKRILAQYRIQDDRKRGSVQEYDLVEADWETAEDLPNIASLLPEGIEFNIL